jgi:hypothetical protein
MFLVLGRPRSRTAWVANLLTVPPASFCLHEGMADAGASLPRLRDRLVGLDAEAVGNADTGLIHHLDETLGLFRDARLVVMTGNDASWKQWCSRMGVQEAVRRKVQDDYERACLILRGRAHFADCREITTDPRAASALWAHCVPDRPFDRERWEVLKDLNIQIIPESLLRRLKCSGLESPRA